MKLRNKQDFWSGVMFAIIGSGFAWKADSYQMGTAARMGPGYFPYWLGVCLAVLGVVVALAALSPKAEETSVERGLAGPEGRGAAIALWLVVALLGLAFWWAAALLAMIFPGRLR